MSDLTVIRYIKSNIFINDLILFNECFENDCSCDYKLDTIYKVWINKPARIKLLGYFKPNPNVYSLIILIQFSKDVTYGSDYMDLYAYVMNFDNAYNVKSTALLGHSVRSNDGLSYSEIKQSLYIKNNIITLKEKSTYFPLDMVVYYPKSDCTKINIYRILINENGLIEEIK